MRWPRPPRVIVRRDSCASQGPANVWNVAGALELDAATLGEGVGVVVAAGLDVAACGGVLDGVPVGLHGCSPRPARTSVGTDPYAPIGWLCSGPAPHRPTFVGPISSCVARFNIAWSVSLAGSPRAL